MLADGVVQELLLERVSSSGLLSNIYKGHVKRVLPGMQAAFIDIGLARTAFLHASDIQLAAGQSSGDDSQGHPEIRSLITEGD